MLKHLPEELTMAKYSFESILRRAVRTFTLSTALAVMLMSKSAGMSVGFMPEKFFSDARDGQKYPTVNIAGMTWFGRNLNYAAEGSFCFDGKPENCVIYGRLYPWDVALRSCPQGWHLSTEEEWRRVETFLGMKPAELGQRKGRGPGIGDALKVGGRSRLEILFAGWRDPEGIFHQGNGHDQAAALWVADEANTATAWHRDVSSARSVVWRSEVDKPYSLSVRCVKNTAATARP
jgi:uncharacterized protein (TIGR02145 family)